MKNSTVSPICSRWITKPVLPSHELEDSVTSRQEAVPGYAQKALGEAHVALVGAGGLGGEVGVGLIRKGVGRLSIFDDDTVALTDLSRQRFYSEDLYKPKASALGANLSREATCHSVIEAYDMTAQDAISKGYLEGVTQVICLVDNDKTRSDCAEFCHEHSKQFITAGVSPDAGHGYVFVQETGRACFRCLFPKPSQGREPCPGVPAVIDILKVLSGIALYALDSLIMERKRDWNYREIHLSGLAPDVSTWVEERGDCDLCGRQEEKTTP